MQTNFLLGSAVAAAALRGGADVVGHLMLPGHVEAQVATHGAAMALAAFVISGYGTATWQRTLEAASEGDSHTWGKDQDAVFKATADYIVWAPIANTGYLLAIPLLTGQGVDVAMQTMCAGFVSVSLLELAIIAPYNLCAYRFIPLDMRVPAQSTLAAAFTIGLAWYC